MRSPPTARLRAVRWRLGAESNRCTRLCRPLHDHSATLPRSKIANPGRAGAPRQVTGLSRNCQFCDLLLTLEKYGVIDRPADMERKRQLAVFQSPPSQTREQVRHESLPGDNLRDALVVQLAGAR